MPIGLIKAFGNGDKILTSQLSPPKFRYFADQNGPKGGDLMKMSFDNFQMQN